MTVAIVQDLNPYKTSMIFEIFLNSLDCLLLSNDNKGALSQGEVT